MSAFVGRITLAIVLALTLSGRASAATIECNNDDDCLDVGGNVCGGKVCRWSGGDQLCVNAGCESQGNEGHCQDASDCKCVTWGAVCAGSRCTFTQPPGSGGAAGADACAQAGAAGAANGGAAGSGGTSGAAGSAAGGVTSGGAAGATGGNAGNAGNAGTGAAGGATSGGASGATGGNAGTGASSNAGSPGSGGSGAPALPDAKSADGGCGCRTRGGDTSNTALGALAFALILLRRRAVGASRPRVLRTLTKSPTPAIPCRWGGELGRQRPPATRHP